ncbi:GerMN domain-containing protein [Kineococcus rhizosphaerae]|uniref:Sporulation and spore germination protein n=1 Tax=Kineococcus rhizosphaerae TaxID=559628 RepID=A0A2T0QX66_9ACTN|nr:GerMN domain-containing protein [Kineococcus rhizosphaerae]PRY10065.1 sporulation and spore germination protein [Kineococcus rhizosphaerae]
MKAAGVARSRPGPAAVLGAGLALALLPALSACGVPSGGRARTIDPSQVPYVLTAPSQPAAVGSAPPPAPAAGDEPRTYFVDRDLHLTPVAADSADTAADVLEQLTSGPTDAQRAAGLQSTIGPQVALRLTSIDDGVALVDVTDLSQALPADRLPLAVGQIVLTLTSAPGVDAVRLQRDGTDREVPLPGGALTAADLAAADYASLLTTP